MIRVNKFTQLEGSEKVAEFGENDEFGESGDSEKNFAKVVDEMITVNKLTRLEGSEKVGEFGKNDEFGESGDSDKILLRLFTK